MGSARQFTHLLLNEDVDWSFSNGHRGCRFRCRRRELQLWVLWCRDLTTRRTIPHSGQMRGDALKLLVRGRLVRKKAEAAEPSKL
jgi:hypothetical protein